MTLENTNRASGAAVWFVLAVVLFVVLTLVVKHSIKVPAIDADRAAIFNKELAEMQAAEEKSLNTPAVTDIPRGIVRLPIESAMKMAAEKWSSPAAARADLAARVTKATVAVKPVNYE
jgi:hypothetical protein